jgi:hypothetical protein
MTLSDRRGIRSPRKLEKHHLMALIALKRYENLIHINWFLLNIIFVVSPIKFVCETLQVQLKYTVNNPISNFFTKKSDVKKSEAGFSPENKNLLKTADTVNIKKKGELSDNPVKNLKNEEKNESADVKKENESSNVNKEDDSLFEPEVFYESEKEKQSSRVKREFDDVKESNDLDSLPVKKEKIAKKEDGQLSLLSYFGKK